MNPIRRLGIAGVLVAGLCLVALPADAQPLSPSELKCQQTVGKEGARYAKKRHQALRACADRQAMGQPCDTAKRDQKIASAAQRLAQKLTSACGGVVLEHLGFPGSCTDPSGPPFTAADLTPCIHDTHAARVDMAIATEYPTAPGPLGSDELKCQQRIGAAAEKFLALKMKYRSRCLNDQLRGRLAPTVDCRAQIQPNGPGTGDARTDSRIGQAIARLRAQIAARCSGVVLANLGFPGMCSDPDGAPFSSTNLQDCIEDGHEQKADEMVNIEYPGGGTTPTPTPTRTSTPGAPTVTATPTPVSCVLPNPLPEVVSLVANPGLDLDIGWTGISHDGEGSDDSTIASIRVSNCDTDTQSPTCGQCDADGPIVYSGPSKNCLCYNLANPDLSSLTVCDPEMPSSCTAPGDTCECFYGPTLPIAAGGVPVCVTRRFATPITGTINIADSGPGAGSQGLDIRLDTDVHNSITFDRPCPTCEGDPIFTDGIRGGTCSGGINAGESCDVAATHVFFGSLAFECLPVRGAFIGDLDIKFTQVTGTTQITSSLPCTSFGVGGAQCPCDTCATAEAEPCRNDGDCPGGSTCGGQRCIGGTNNGMPCEDDSGCAGGGSCGRVGEASRPNPCSNGVCVPNTTDPANPNDGRCQTGPSDGVCSIETYRACGSSPDCNPPASGGNCATCAPGQTCTIKRRECFLGTITRQGTPDVENPVVASTFCVQPTASSSVNGAAGVPGAGATVQPITVYRTGADCGNGVLDATEQCDPPMDAACSGECRIDCRCPGTGCGNGMVEVPEECDGDDDGACPGGCQTDCTCGAFCGDDVASGTEECDGTDDGACPGLCLASCVCAVCGDGDVNQPSEQCDGADDLACPGACQPSCTCGAFCGDGTIDGTEECDGAATGACAGTCADDCTCAPFCGNGEREAGENCDPGPPSADDALCPGECQANCTCPAIGTLSFVVQDGADLDAGWTGVAHDVGVQTGTRLDGEIAACDTLSDPECTYFANVGSFCSGDPSQSCVDSAQCALGQTCVINTYGPPLPVSAGGVPVCVVVRFAGDVTGTYNLETGASAIRMPLNAAAHLSTNTSQPCPICNCASPPCDVGESGTCSDGPGIGQACVVEGTGVFGPTSNDCPPNPATSLADLVITMDPATTGTVSDPSDQPCDGNGFQTFGCWCDGQTQPNACNAACDGGTRDGLSCTGDAQCPNAPAGSCKPLCRQEVGGPIGEGRCAAGPIDRTCALAQQIPCTTDAECGALGPCVTSVRRCFMDPIVRQGAPGTTSNVLGATFCVPPTGTPAIDDVSGLPGAGAMRLPNTVAVKLCGDDVVNQASEECDGADDANCPGQCAPNCECATVCGNGMAEFGEQCDPGMPPTVLPDDTACPGTCAASGSANECTCPAVCGDGFTGPGEQCDPGGIPPGTPASDAACPGQCTPGVCQCPPPLCGNGTIEAGELCEFPAVNCGPLQLCNIAPPTGCLACVP